MTISNISSIVNYLFLKTTQTTTANPCSGPLSSYDGSACSCASIKGLKLSSDGFVCSCETNMVFDVDTNTCICDSGFYVSRQISIIIYFFEDVYSRYLSC